MSPPASPRQRLSGFGGASLNTRILFAWLLLALATPLWAGEADALLQEQLDLLQNQDIKSTVRVLQRLNKFFLIEHQETTPAPTPTETQRRLGYLLFTRNYLEEVYYNTNPRPGEITNELRLFASPGEYEPVSFSVKPLENLSAVTVTCSELRGPGGSVMGPDEVDVRFARQLARGVKSFIWMVGPEALEPFASLEIPQGRTTQFWLTAHVPEGAAPGAYRGSVTFKPANRPESELSLSLVVLPFRLLEDPDMNFGWYYSGGNPQTRRAELADMRAHGFNTVTVPEPTIRSLTPEGQADIDFGNWESYRELGAELGMNGIKQSGISAITSAITARGSEELGTGFDVAFEAALRQYKAWLNAHPDFKMVLVIYDEPRESLLNPWNRNFDQTVAYLKLCRRVPGLRLSVNPMGDASDNKDYTPFAGLVDILSTHAWSGSAQLIAETKRLGKTLWVYNNGYSRLAWGLSLWKLGAKGNWQWAYFGYGGGDPYSPLPTGGFENEGESNTGRAPAYCFADRIIPTPKYEWVREGIDDYKYLYTLLEKLREADAPAAGEARRQAEKLLAEIAAAVPDYPATGLQTGAEAGGAGDPVHLLAYFDHYRWRLALCVLQLEDAQKGRKPTDPGSLYAAYSRFEFGRLPAATGPAAVPLEGVGGGGPADAVEVERTVLQPGAKLLFDFETDDCLQQLETDALNPDDPFDPDLMPAKPDRSIATHGQYSLHFEPAARAGGLHLINFDADWRGYDLLRMDFYSPTDVPVSASLCLTDASTKAPYPRAMGQYDDRFDLESFVIPPGKYTLEIELGGLCAKNGRPFDMSRIRKMAIVVEGNKARYYLDCVRLERR